MAILIDGYNLIHAMGLGKDRYGPRGLEKARRGLLGLLAGSLSAREAERTTVIFDAAGAPPGAPQQFHYHGITVRFAASHAEADALIEELIAEDSAPRRLTVVSGDRRLQRAARRRRARAVDSEAFLEELARSRGRRRGGAPSKEQRAKQHGPASEAETERWLREFADLADDKILQELWPFELDRAADSDLKKSNRRAADSDREKSNRGADRNRSDGGAARKRKDRR